MKSNQELMKQGITEKNQLKRSNTCHIINLKQAGQSNQVEIKYIQAQIDKSKSKPALQTQQERSANYQNTIKRVQSKLSTQENNNNTLTLTGGTRDTTQHETQQDKGNNTVHLIATTLTRDLWK